MRTFSRASDPGDPRRLPLALVRFGAALVGLSLLFSMWASPDRLRSLPWFIISMVGVVTVLVVTGRFLPRVARRVSAHHWMIFFLSATFLALGTTLLTSRWPAYKLSWLTTVYSALPSIRSLPLWWTQQGLQPNQTGGFLALCCAFTFAVAVAREDPAGPAVRRGRLYRWVAVVLTALGVLVVFMTGSRSALAGLAVAVLAVLIVRFSHPLWAWAAGISAVVVGLLASGQLTRVFGLLMRDETLDTKLVARLDIWSSAIKGIQDHSFTGIGLGVFNQVVPFRYPYQTVGLSYNVTQAHNLFLDTALTIGVPGLLGLLIFLAGIIMIAVRGMRQDYLTRVISLGVVASTVVYLIFGITDQISFTIPTSFIIWLWACALAMLVSRTE